MCLAHAPSCSRFPLTTTPSGTFHAHPPRSLAAVRHRWNRLELGSVRRALRRVGAVPLLFVADDLEAPAVGLAVRKRGGELPVEVHGGDVHGGRTGSLLDAVI